MPPDDENIVDESVTQEPVTTESNVESVEPVSAESNVEDQATVIEAPALEVPVEIQIPESPVEETPALPIEPEVPPVIEPMPEVPVGTELNVGTSNVEGLSVSTESNVGTSNVEGPSVITESNVEMSNVESIEPERPVVLTPETPPVVPEPAPTPPIAPVLHDPKYTKDIPQKILELTPEEINAARLLWARENIAAAQKQGNINRLKNMNRIMDEIETVVRANPKTTTHVIAKSVNLSERSAANYIQKLVHAGRINASGNSSNRRYFI